MVRRVDNRQTSDAVREHLSETEDGTARFTDFDFDLMCARDCVHQSTCLSGEEIDSIPSDELLDFFIEGLQEDVACLDVLGQ